MKQTYTHIPTELLNPSEVIHYSLGLNQKKLVQKKIIHHHFLKITMDFCQHSQTSDLLLSLKSLSSINVLI